jgi:hypothetical protein
VEPKITAKLLHEFNITKCIYMHNDPFDSLIKIFIKRRKRRRRRVRDDTKEKENIIEQTHHCASEKKQQKERISLIDTTLMPRSLTVSA